MIPRQAFFILLALIPPMALSLQAAEEAKISVKSEIDRAFITIGDPVIYTVTVRHDPKIKILSPFSPPSPDILKIKKVEDIRQEDAGMLIEGRRFTLTAFGLGEFILEPLEVKYLDPEGNQQTLQTDKIFLTVKSVAEGEEKTDIRGIKGVIKLPSKILSILYILFAFALATAVFLFFKSRKAKGPVKSPEPALSAEEEAMLALNHLFDSDLIRRAKIKEYYLRLSEILRTYFDRRFLIQASEATTYEIMKALKEKETPSELRTLISEVLEAADLAKFAKWKPEPAEVVLLNQKSKQIIEQAKPKETAGGI
jgi:hypothetical protein